MAEITKDGLIAIGTHGFIKETHQKAEWYCSLEQIINMLKPTGIIIYGSMNGKIFDEFKDSCKFYYYEPWIYSDRKNRGGIQNVN